MSIRKVFTSESCCSWSIPPSDPPFSPLPFIPRRRNKTKWQIIAHTTKTRINTTALMKHDTIATHRICLPHTKNTNPMAVANSAGVTNTFKDVAMNAIHHFRISPSRKCCSFPASSSADGKGPSIEEPRSRFRGEALLTANISQRYRNEQMLPAATIPTEMMSETSQQAAAISSTVRRSESPMVSFAYARRETSSEARNTAW